MRGRGRGRVDRNTGYVLRVQSRGHGSDDKVNTPIVHTMDSKFTRMHGDDPASLWTHQEAETKTVGWLVENGGGL